MLNDSRGHILVVDDEPSMRTTLSILLRRHKYTVSQAEDGVEALEILARGGCDLVISDLKMDPMDGIELLKRCKAMSPSTELMIFTAYGTVDSAVEAMKQGAFDYIGKPFDQEELLLKVSRALEHRSLVSEVRRLKQELKHRKGMGEGIIAKSPAMAEVLEKAAQVAPTEATVLIQGESGTGKELVAAAVHHGSPRRNEAFIPVNCSNLSDTLLESELFGHEKGAFTGADRDRKGLFEAADRGTMLLDEIGDMPGALQGKILRVLQEGEVRKIGSTVPLKVNVRILAATNRDIDAFVAQGLFREDLFYRLNVVRIEIPPLRERRDDIVPLAHHFLDIYREKSGKRLKGFSRGAIQAMMAHPWHGNVREMENAVERGVILARSDSISEDDLSLHPAPEAGPVRDNETTLIEIEKQHILDTLRRHKGNRAAASRELGIGRNTLWRRLKRYGMDKKFQ